MVAARPGQPVTEDATERTRLPRLVWVLGAVGVALAVIGAVLFVVPPADGKPADSAESKAVVSRVSDFAIAYNTYDVADPKEYQARLSGLLTSDYNTEFVQITDALFAAIADKKQKSADAAVRDVAVESIDADSAVVLAVVDAKVTNTDNEGAVLRQFRWTVNLQKVAGQWRVARFESVAAQPADAPAPGTTDPSATPEPGATSGTGGTPTPSATPSATPSGDAE